MTESKNTNLNRLDLCSSTDFLPNYWTIYFEIFLTFCVMSHRNADNSLSQRDHVKVGRGLLYLIYKSSLSELIQCFMVVR